MSLAYLAVYIWRVERWSNVRSANLNELNPLPPDVRFLRKTVETKAVAVHANTIGHTTAETSSLPL